MRGKGTCARGGALKILRFAKWESIKKEKSIAFAMLMETKFTMEKVLPLRGQTRQSRWKAVHIEGGMHEKTISQLKSDLQ